MGRTVIIDVQCRMCLFLSVYCLKLKFPYNIAHSPQTFFFFSAGQRFPPHLDALLGEFRVGGGVHDSCTFQCELVGSFTSPGIDTRKTLAKRGKRNCQSSEAKSFPQ